MKKITPLLFSFLALVGIQAQTVVESVHNQSKSTVIIEGSLSNNLTVDFLQQHELGSSDTTFMLMFARTSASNINKFRTIGKRLLTEQERTVCSSDSNGLNLTTNSYLADQFISFEDFEALYEQFNGLYIHMTTLSNFDTNHKQIVGSCEVGGVSIGAEIDLRNQLFFYVEFENQIITIDDESILDLLKFFEQVKNYPTTT